MCSPAGISGKNWSLQTTHEFHIASYDSKLIFVKLILLGFLCYGMCFLSAYFFQSL